MTRVQMERTSNSASANVGVKKRQSGDMMEEFRKILRDKPEDLEQPAKDSTAAKKDMSEEEEASTVETKETAKPEEMLYAFGVGQLIREVQTPVFTEEAAETEVPILTAPETDISNVQPEISPFTEETLAVPTSGEMIQKESTVQPTAADGKSVQPKTESIIDQVGLAVSEEKPVQEMAGAEKKAVDSVVAKESSEMEISSTRQAVKPEEQTEEEEGRQDGEEYNTQAAWTGADVRRAYTNVHRTSYEGTQEVVHVSTPEELAAELPKSLIQNITRGKNEFEIFLEPANLGRIAVKVLYEAGQTTISILCSEKRTMAMLGQRAGEIGAVMEQRLGDTTTVLVEERPTEDYQDGRSNSQAGRESEQDRQREEQQKAKHEDNSHFLQRLRLGLAE